MESKYRHLYDRVVLVWLRPGQVEVGEDIIQSIRLINAALRSLEQNVVLRLSRFEHFYIQYGICEICVSC